MNNYEETIYGLIPKYIRSEQQDGRQKKESNTRYRSIFADNVVRDFTQNQYSHRTMGPAAIVKPDPKQPLRCRQHSKALPEVSPIKKIHLLPPIPKIDQNLSSRTKPSRNFIKENIDKIMNTSPVCPRRYITSDRKGNKFLIDGSGLQKEYILKKNYGKVPKYLKLRMINEEKVDEPLNPKTIKCLSDEERVDLLQSLRCTYEHALVEFQRLPLRCDTHSVLTRKTYLNEQLNHLERDIAFLDKHKQIFVTFEYNNN